MKKDTSKAFSCPLLVAGLFGAALMGCAQLDDDESLVEWTEMGDESDESMRETLDADPLDPEPSARVDPVAPGGEATLAAYADCGWGEICFYTGRDGTGEKCSWSSYDEDWNGGSVRCSWASTHNACSVYNKTSVRFEYFLSANYRNRIGSTGGWSGGNLACSYKLASHRRQ